MNYVGYAISLTIYYFPHRTWQTMRLGGWAGLPMLRRKNRERVWVAGHNDGREQKKWKKKIQMEN